MVIRLVLTGHDRAKIFISSNITRIYESSLICYKAVAIECYRTDSPCSFNCFLQRLGKFLFSFYVANSAQILEEFAGHLFGDKKVCRYDYMSTSPTLG